MEITKNMKRCQYHSGDEEFKSKIQATDRANILRNSIKKSYKDGGGGINLRIKVLRCSSKWVVRSESRRIQPQSTELKLKRILQGY